MRLRRVEQDQVEPAVDHRAHGPSTTADFISVEVLEVILEAARSEEGSRHQPRRLEIDRSAAGPEEGLDHRRHLRRGHVRPKLGHLPIVSAALPDDGLSVLHAGDEADGVEIGPVLGPVLHCRDVVEKGRRLLVPLARRRDRDRPVADPHLFCAD